MAKTGKTKMAWLELNGCSGNIISLLNGSEPSFQYLITEMVDLVYDHSLISCEGEEAMATLFSLLDEDFILAVEGAVATKNNGLYQIIGSWKGDPVTGMEAVSMLGERALHVIAVGACAAHGGVSAGDPNPSRCVSVQSVLNRRVINLPGCPCHPDWFIGTLAHLLYYGEPQLDEEGDRYFCTGSPFMNVVREDHILIRESLRSTWGSRPVCFESGARDLSRRLIVPSGNGTTGSTGPYRPILLALAALSLAFRTEWRLLSHLPGTRQDLYCRKRPERQQFHKEGKNERAYRN